MFKKWLWNWVFDYLTKPVKLDHILKVSGDTGQVWMDGRLLEAAEVASLQEQVKAFQTMSLKTILLNTPVSLAQDRIFKDSKSMDDVIAGKLILYTIDIQEQVMTKILNAPKGNQVMVQQNPYKR